MDRIDNLEAYDTMPAYRAVLKKCAASHRRHANADGL
jgi:hypothetical protein